jgi:hypothetical protein
MKPTQLSHILKHRQVQKTAIKITRKAKKADKIYNKVTNPISLYEITYDDLPDVIPYHEIIHHVLHQIPCFDVLSGVYDGFAFKKDLVETVWRTYMKHATFQSLEHKKKVLSIVKLITLCYKIWIMSCIAMGIPKSHDTVVSCFDYINFVVSNIED